MISLRCLLVSEVVCTLGIVTTVHVSAPAAARAKKQPARAEVHVELFRGLANVFSRGMDRLGERLNREGYHARVFHHSAWRRVVQQIGARRGDQRQIVVLIGHSLGAQGVPGCPRPRRPTAHICSGTARRPPRSARSSGAGSGSAVQTSRCQPSRRGIFVAIARLVRDPNRKSSTNRARDIAKRDASSHRQQRLAVRASGY